MRKSSKSDRVLGRRVFMKALGVGIAAPLAFRMGRLAMAEPGAAPVRLLIYYIPNGVPVEQFEPFGSGAGFLASSNVLAPLAPFASNVTVVKGLSMSDGAENHEAITAVLTGRKDGGDVNSIDHTIAQSLGVEPYTLGVIPKAMNQEFDRRSFLIKHGTWVRATESPIEAAAQMLGARGGQSTGAPDLDETDFRKEAIGLTETELDGMHAALKGLTKEQNKLSVHLDSLRALKASFDRPVVNGCAEAPALPAVDAMQGRDPGSYDNLRYIIDAQLEVAANAMVCGTGRVITMQNLWTPAEVVFNFPDGPGISKTFHNDLSHARSASGRAEFAQSIRWFYERLADKLLPALSQPDPLDPGRTVLDNTLIYVCSELCDGADHNSVARTIYMESGPLNSYLPTVLIGRAGGYLAQKDVVSVSRNHGDMLATLAEAMGAPISDIGGMTVQPIQELKS